MCLIACRFRNSSFEGATCKTRHKKPREAFLLGLRDRFFGEGIAFYGPMGPYCGTPDLKPTNWESVTQFFSLPL
jgi:hypothetical protein